MSLLLRIEKWLETRIERLFGPPESVQPIEIARRMVRAMEDQRRISVERTYVPNSFVVHVSEGDLAELRSFTQTLEQDLANHVKAAARRLSMAFGGAVTVSFASDPSLGRGETRVDAQFVEGEPEEVLSPQGQTGQYVREPAMIDPDQLGATKSYPVRGVGPYLWRLSAEEGPDTGTSYTVRLPASIGREQGCDVQLHDPKVSRQHARLEMAADGVFVVDADSTNGTRLNGRLVRRAKVTAGDVVEVGTTRLALYPVSRSES